MPCLLPLLQINLPPSIQTPSIPCLHLLLPPYCQLTIVPDQRPFLLSQVIIKESKNVHPTHHPRSSEIADKSCMIPTQPLVTTPHLHPTPIHSIGGRELFFFFFFCRFFFLPRATFYLQLVQKPGQPRLLENSKL